MYIGELESVIWNPYHTLRVFFFFFFQAEDGIRDADVTGVQTCALPISPAGRDLQQRLRRRFAKHWQVLIPRHWAGTSPELLVCLAADLPAVAQPEPDDWQDLRGFAEGYRGFELTLPLLRETCSWPGWMAWLAGQEDAGLWCRAVLQGWSWSQLQGAALVTGKREGETRLRQIVARWLAQGPEL